MYSDVSALLADPEIRAVVLATPAVQHYAGAKEALLAGKHVLVEKPLALRAEEAEELSRLATDRGLVLMVGHLLEYHPAFVKLRELVAGGELGDIVYLYSHRLSLGKIRQEENAFWSLSPHDLSMIVRLMGEMPELVEANGAVSVTPGVADAVTAMLRFQRGTQAHVFVSWLHPFKEQRLVVVGAKQMAVFDDVAKEAKLKLYPSHVEWKRGQPVPVSGELQAVEYEPGEPLRRECEHFLACIETGRSPLTGGASGVQITRILEACQRSLDKQGARIVVEEKDYFVHPTAVIDEDCEIGAGTKIWHFVHVLSNSHIGRGCVIGQNVSIGPHVSIGSNVKIQNNVSVYRGVTLEDDVFCGPACVFTNVFNPRSHVTRMHELRPTLVKRGATIGANATIVCGNTIGCYAMVGAGAVITRDVPDYALVHGNPARVHGWMCNCGEKLTFTGERAMCATCGREYLRRDQRVEEQVK